MKNHYEILGVPRDAGVADIAAAHRDMVSRVYAQSPPDADRLTALREAYRVLIDETERKAYDTTLPLERRAVPRRPSARGSDDVVEPSWLANWKLLAPIAAVVVIAIGWQVRKKPVPVQPKIATVAREATPAMVQAPANAPVADTDKTSQEIFAMAGASVVRVRTNSGSGSGVVISGDTVITNCHVVMPWRSAFVEFDRSPHRFPATLVVADEELDLCKLSVPGLPARPVALGSVANVSNHQTVFAIGAPGGGPIGITEGVVTTLHGITAGNVIQTTAYVRPGSSGGGLFSATGKLIGIVTFLQRGPDERNYAIPVDWISRMETRAGSGQQDEVVPPIYMPVER
ncbi:MAG: trypsin-like peptidase domain-containing protein [Betaproteobacteria bacterium]